MKVQGYGAYFNIRNGHNSVVLPGAFKRTVEHVAAGGKIPIYASHGWAEEGIFGIQRNTGRRALPVGVVTHAAEDELGLYFEADIFDDPADELAGAVRSTLRALGPRPASIAFSHNGAIVEEQGKGENRTTVIHSLPPLEEISIVHKGSDPLAYIEAAPVTTDEPPAPVAAIIPADAGQETA